MPLDDNSVFLDAMNEDIQPIEAGPESAEPEAPEGEPAPEVPEVDDPSLKPVDDPLSLVNMEMLANPALREQYLGGQQPQQQQPAPQPQQQQPQGLPSPLELAAHRLGVSPDEMNTLDPIHFNAMLTANADLIRHEQELAQQQQQQQAAQLEARTQAVGYVVQHTEKHIPGFGELLKSQSFEDRQLVAGFEREVMTVLQSKYGQHQALWTSPRVLGDAVNTVVKGGFGDYYKRVKGQAKGNPSLHVEGSSAGQPVNKSAEIFKRYERNNDTGSLGAALLAASQAS